MLSTPGESRSNNFDLLRIAAAYAVLVSHSFALTGHGEPSFRGINLGTAAVMVFFGVSGFLVTQSWTIDPHVGRYAAKRALRIFPGLVCVVLVCAFLLGPLVTAVELHEYFTSPTTYGYVVHNVTMFEMRYELPGVFLSNPFPRAVNGSLWTLKSEFHAYWLIASVGLLGLAYRKLWLASLVAVGAICIVAPTVMLPLADANLLLSFCVGAALFLCRTKIRWRWDLSIVSFVLVSVMPVELAAREVLAAFAIPYTALMLAYRTPATARFLKNRDLSYGTYLWAFPVQQLIAQADPTTTPLEMVLFSTLATLPAAAASWFFIEKPALRLKQRLTASSRPTRAVA